MRWLQEMKPWAGRLAEHKPWQPDGGQLFGDPVLSGQAHDGAGDDDAERVHQ